MALTAPTLAEVKLALRIDGDDGDGVLTNNVAAAVERVNRDAPDVPQSVGTEAVIRFVGYLYDGLNVYSTPDGWRHSGAEALIRPWAVRRAGVVTT